MKTIDLSIIIPVYKSEKTIFALIKNLVEILQNITFEVILVNDGSPDNSDSICCSIVKQFPHITYLQLRKNFGEFNAVFCGLSHARGSYAVMIDDDFQNPPSEIIKLYETATKGNFDVVYAQYETKNHHFIRNAGSQLINSLSTWLINKPKDLYLSSFKIISNELIQEIIKYKSPQVYLDGIIFQLTNNISKVTVQHNKREHSQSSYSSKKLISLFLNAFLGYSTLPARLILLSGFIFLTLGLLLCFWFLFQKNGNWLFAIILICTGIVQTSLGVLGDYLVKNNQIAIGKPIFTIKKKLTSHDDRK